MPSKNDIRGYQGDEFDPTLKKKRESPGGGVRKLSYPSGKSSYDTRKTGKIAGSLPPEPAMANTANPAKTKKKNFDEGPFEDKPFGGMGGMSGFRISIGGFGGPEDPKSIKNREKQTGTNVPMYIHNEKSAKSNHSPSEWNEDQREAKKMGVSPAKYDTFENTPEAHRKSVRSSIKQSIKQIKGRR